MTISHPAANGIWRRIWMTPVSPSFGARSETSTLSSDAVSGHEVAIHLASNPDIALAAIEPAIDFDQGTALTHHVVEAARRTGVTQAALRLG